jgi:hypothetical protein
MLGGVNSMDIMYDKKDANGAEHAPKGTPEGGRFTGEGGGGGSSESGEMKSAGETATKEIGKELIPIDRYLSEHGTAKGADKYLKEHFQGKHVTDKDEVKVRFSKIGNSELTYKINSEKAEALPHIPDIIRTGEKSTEDIYKKRDDYSEMVKYTKEIGKDKKYALKAGKLKKIDKDPSLRAYSFKKEVEDKKSDSNVWENFLRPNSLESLSSDNDTLPDIWEIVNIEVEKIDAASEKALDEMADRICRRITERFREKEKAALTVRPILGDIKPLAYDSVEDIYRAALTAEGYDAGQYPKESYRSMIDVLLKMRGFK